MPHPDRRRRADHSREPRAHPRTPRASGGRGARGFGGLGASILAGVRPDHHGSDDARNQRYSTHGEDAGHGARGAGADDHGLPDGHHGPPGAPAGSRGLRGQALHAIGVAGPGEPRPPSAPPGRRPGGQGNSCRRGRPVRTGGEPPPGGPLPLARAFLGGLSPGRHRGDRNRVEFPGDPRQRGASRTALRKRSHRAGFRGLPFEDGGQRRAQRLRPSQR